MRISKHSDHIDNACITRLGYEHDGRHWVEKAARALAVVDVETDEEADMDIPSPLPTAPPSPHSHPPLTDGVGSSSAPPNWYQRLSQCLYTISLDFQQLHQNHQEDMRLLTADVCTLFRDFHAYQEEQDRRFGTLESQQAEILQILRSQFHPPPPQ